MATKEEYQRLRERCINEGICLKCRNNREDSHSKWYCLSCLEINKRHDATKRARRKSAGLCNCGKRRPESGKKSCFECLSRGVEYQSDRRDAHRTDNSCITCGKPPMLGASTCENCAQRATAATLKRYNTNKQNRVCPFCAAELNEKFRCDNCHIKHLTRNRIRWTKQRLLVINHYGQSCRCCGCSDLKFLEIDHINNDGARHREIVGRHVIESIIKDNYPSHFQTLCANCNRGKGKFGVCPHKSAPLALSKRAKTKRKQRLECINHYGGKCVFCQETNWAFLEFDHINNDGKRHRLIKNFPKWLIENGFPTDIQLLCSNCNKAKGLYGYNPLVTEYLSQ